jgi:hypothetical protein
MERVICQNRRRGAHLRPVYFRDWHVFGQGCRPLPRWTYRQGLAARFIRRSDALVMVARICAEEFDDADLSIVRLVGTTAAAANLVTATALADDLGRHGTSKRARRAAEKEVIRRFGILMEAISAVMARRG